jgi:hypothetical protein
VLVEWRSALGWINVYFLRAGRKYNIISLSTTTGNIGIYSYKIIYHIIIQLPPTTTAVLVAARHSHRSTSCCGSAAAAGIVYEERVKFFLIEYLICMNFSSEFLI